MSDDNIIEVDKSQDNLQYTLNDPQNDLQGHPSIVINDPQDDLQKGLLEISPNGKYLFLYIEEYKEFVGWYVEYDEEKNIQVGEYVVEDKQVELEDYEIESEDIQVESESEVKYRLVNVHNRRIRHLCVSDKKILA